MNKWITCLALAGKGGVRGARGFAPVTSSAAVAWTPDSSVARPSAPIPMPHWQSISRRLTTRTPGDIDGPPRKTACIARDAPGPSVASINEDKFVREQERQTELVPDRQGLGGLHRRA